jgi:acyl-coenzyme A synthetase/AMP-(fatty) acid ligase
MQAAQVLIAAIVSRSKDADAKALLTAAGTYRRGKFCPMKPMPMMRRRKFQRCGTLLF